MIIDDIFLHFTHDCGLQERKQRAEKGKNSEDSTEKEEEEEEAVQEDKEEPAITLRPLNMEDMRQAKNQVIEISESARNIKRTNKCSIFESLYRQFFCRLLQALLLKAR